MNPKPGWVRHMAKVYDMIERVDFLDEIRETERKKAAERLQNEIRAFVTYEGQSYTYDCPSTGCSYSLLCDGNILIKEDDDAEEEEIEVKDLSIEEMETLREFMVDMLDTEIKYEKEEIDRYTNLCL